MPTAKRVIATVSRRFAAAEAHNPAIKILKPPPEMVGFKYLMIWHPRVNMGAAHRWLRIAVSDAGKSVV